MSFIGVITNAKNIDYMLKKLEAYFNQENLFFITEKNIHNMRNIKFETIVIDDKISKLPDLKYIVSNSKYVILNADIEDDLEMLENLQLMVISYGFNHKATFSISSVSENNMIICLQRTIISIKNKKIEPHEIEISIMPNSSIHAEMCMQILCIIYQKIET